MTRRECLVLMRGIAVAAVAAGGLAACGRKNRPEPPEGADYPHQYPYVPPAERTESPAAPAPKTEDKSDNQDLFLKLAPEPGGWK